MVKLSDDELATMRRLATQGHGSDFGGSIDEEREPDAVIQMRRSDLLELQRWLRRAADEIEDLYTRP
jgi:hypothetical protein